MDMPDWDTTPEQMVPLSLIDRPERPARQESYEDDIEELADEIAENGLINAVQLRMKPDGRYEIVAGDKRTLAHVLLQKEAIRAKVADLTDQQVEEIKGQENFRRVEMNPMEEARFFHHYMITFGVSAEQAGRKFQRSATFLKILTRLMELPEEMQEAMIQGKINKTQALEIVQARTEATRMLMFDYALKGNSALMLREWRKSAERTGTDVKMQEIIDKHRETKPQENPSAGMLCYDCTGFTDYCDLTYVHLCRLCRGDYDAVLAYKKAAEQREAAGKV